MFMACMSPCKTNFARRVWGGDGGQIWRGSGGGRIWGGGGCRIWGGGSQMTGRAPCQGQRSGGGGGMGLA
jgi:hypothetical protein